MSSGVISDREETRQQVKTPKPIKDGKTWLRHNETSQSGQIDLLVLSGKFSIDEMVYELRRQGLFGNGHTYEQSVKRVKDHLAHLQQGDARNKASGMKPHNLKLAEVNGKWSFDVS
jgi:hypothetical protein